MTLEEKRDALFAFCKERNCNCAGCRFNTPNVQFCDEYKIMDEEVVERDYAKIVSKIDRAYILHTAEQMVCGHREQDYGTPENNFSAIADLWNSYLDIDTLTARDVALMMCLFKIARIKTGTGTVDSYVDLAGYAACGGEIQNDT